MSWATDWALKRFLKLVLKKNLGRYLFSELDVNQLDVELSSGHLALRNVLLDVTNVNKDLALKGWRVRAGYVGRVSATLPLGYNATTCCAVELDELLLTIAAEDVGPLSSTGTSDYGNGPQGSSGAHGSHQPLSQGEHQGTGGAFNALGEPNPFAGFSLEDLGLSGQAAVGDSIQRIAGGLQAVLQQLRVTATNVTIRIEVPLALAQKQQPQQHAAGSSSEVGIITVRIDRVEACDCSDTPSGPAGPGGQGATGGHAPQASSAGMSGGESKTSVKDVLKSLNVRGLSVDMGSGPAIVTALEESLMAPSPRAHTTSTSTSTASPGAGTASTASPHTPPLLRGVSSSGVDVSVLVTMTWADALVGGGNGSSGSSSNGGGWRRPSHVALDVQLSALAMDVSPSHLACMAAAVEHASQLSQQGSGSGSTRSGTTANGARVSEGGWSQPPAVAANGPRLQGHVGHGQGQQPYYSGHTALHVSQPQQHWGASSLFMEELLAPNFTELVAHNLQPYVAQSFSLADSMMSDADGPHGLMGTAASHPHFNQSHQYSDTPYGGTIYGGTLYGQQGGAPVHSHQHQEHYQQHPRGYLDTEGHAGGSGLGGEYGALAAGLHLPPGSSLGDSMSEDRFHDARSVVSSIANSLAASTASVIGYMSGAAGGAGAAGAQSHTHPVAGHPGYVGSSAHTPQHAHAPPPPPPAPTYKITVTSQDVRLALCYSHTTLATSTGCFLTPASAHPLSWLQQQAAAGSGFCEPRAVPAPLPGLVLSCSDVKASIASTARGLDLSFQLFGVMAHELLPAVEQGAVQAARDFAAAPGRLPQGLHCFRPDLGFWRGDERAGTHSHSSASNGTPTKHVAGGAQGAAEHGQPLLHWPLLCCASGSSHDGGRPSVGFKAHLPGSSHESGAGGGRRSSSRQSHAGSGPGIGHAHGYASLGSHTGNGQSSGYGVVSQPRKAPPHATRASVDLLGITVWLSEGAMARLTAAAAEVIAGLSGRTTQQAGAALQSSPGTPFHTPNGKAASVSGVAAGAPTGAMSPASTRRAAVQAVNDSIRAPAAGAHTAAAAATAQQHMEAAATTATALLQPKPRGPLPELELTVSVPHICIITALAHRHQSSYHQDSKTSVGPCSHSVAAKGPDTSSSSTGGALSTSTSTTVYAALDVLSTTHHDHVAHHRMGPHRGLPLIRLVSGKQSGELVLKDMATLDVAASHVRVHLLHPLNLSIPTRSAPTSSPSPQLLAAPAHRRTHRPGSPVGATTNQAATQMVSSCILELRPHAGATPHASSGHGAAHGLLGSHQQHVGDSNSTCVGPDAVPPGCALFAQVSWQLWGSGGPEGAESSSGGESVLHKALQYAGAHAKGSAGSDGESEASGSSPWEAQHPGGPGSIHVCELEERCRRSSDVFAHVCMPGVHVHLRQLDLSTLCSLGPASPPTAPAAGTNNTNAAVTSSRMCSNNQATQQGSLQAEQPAKQVTVLVNTRVYVTLECSPPEPSLRPSSTVDNSTAQPAPAAGADASAAQAARHAPSQQFVLQVQDITLLHATNLAGTRGASCTSLGAQGLELRLTPNLLPSQAASSAGHHPSTPGGAPQVSLQAPTTTSHAQTSEWWRASPTQPVVLVYCPMQPTGSPRPPPCIDLLTVTCSSTAMAQYRRSITGGLGMLNSPTGAGAAGAKAGGIWGRSAASSGPGVTEAAPASPVTHSPAQTHSSVSVLVRGMTLSTDYGNVTMNWLQQLAAALSSSSSSSSSRSTTAAETQVPTGAGFTAAAAHKQGKQQGSAMMTDNSASTATKSITVCLQDVALRYEPLPYPLRAALDVRTTPVPGTAGATTPATTTTSTAPAGGTSTSGNTPARPKSRSGPNDSMSTQRTGQGTTPPTPQPPLHISPVAVAMIVEHVRFEARARGRPGADQDGPLSPTSPSSAIPATASAGTAGVGHAQESGSVSYDEHMVELVSIGLHLALADGRGQGWGPGDARDLASTQLQTCGYHCVLQESALRVRVRVATAGMDGDGSSSGSTAGVPLATAGAGASSSVTGTTAAASAAATAATARPAAGQPQLDVEVTNQQLLGILTQDSAALLLQLMSQLGVMVAATSPRPVPTPAGHTATSSSSGQAGGGDAPGAGKVGIPGDSSGEEEGEEGAAGMGPGGGGVDAATKQLIEQLISQDFFTTRPVQTQGQAGADIQPSTARPGATGAGGAFDSGGSEEAGLVDVSPTVLAALARSNATRPWQATGTEGSFEEVEHTHNTSDMSASSADGVLMATPASGVAAGGTELGQQQPIRHANAHGGSVQGSQQQLSSRPDTPLVVNGCVLIDDFFEAQDSEGSEEDEVGGAWCDWDETVAAAGGRARVSGRGPPSPPEPSGVWYGAADGSPGTGAAGSLSPGGGAGHGIVYGSPARNSPAAGARGAAPWSPASYRRAASGAAARGAAGSSNSSAPTARGGAAASASPAAAPSTKGPAVHEDHYSAAGEDEADGFLGGAAPGHAGRKGPAPTPVSRITFKNMSGLWALHTTRVSGSVTAGRLEAEVERATLVLETYAQSGHEARQLRLSVHALEVRDCTAPQGPGAHSSAAAAPTDGVPASAGGLASAAGGLAAGVLSPAAGAAASLKAHAGAKWVSILSYRQRKGRLRDSRTPQLGFVLSVVRPEPLARPDVEELRLKAAVLPLRLRLDQDVLSYARGFWGAVMTPHTAAAMRLLGDMQVVAQGGCSGGSVVPFFQRAEVAGWSLTIDYRPRRIDMAALKEGSLLELLNLVPLGGLGLKLKPLALGGLAGWDALGAAAARDWLNDIMHNQAHAFLKGLAPVDALVRAGSAVRELVLGGDSPVARHLSRGAAVAAGMAAGPTTRIKRLGRSRLAVQVRQGVVALTQVLIAEALGVGAHVARSASDLVHSSGASLATRVTSGSAQQGSQRVASGAADRDAPNAKLRGSASSQRMGGVGFGEDEEEEEGQAEEDEEEVDEMGGLSSAVSSATNGSRGSHSKGSSSSSSSSLIPFSKSLKRGIRAAAGALHSSVTSTAAQLAPAVGAPPGSSVAAVAASGAALAGKAVFKGARSTVKAVIGASSSMVAQGGGSSGAGSGGSSALQMDPLPTPGSTGRGAPTAASKEEEGQQQMQRHSSWQMGQEGALDYHIQDDYQPSTVSSHMAASSSGHAYQAAHPPAAQLAASVSLPVRGSSSGELAAAGAAAAAPGHLSNGGSTTSRVHPRGGKRGSGSGDGSGRRMTSSAVGGSAGGGFGGSAGGGFGGSIGGGVGAAAGEAGARRSLDACSEGSSGVGGWEALEGGCSSPGPKRKVD